MSPDRTKRPSQSKQSRPKKLRMNSSKQIKKLKKPAECLTGALSSEPNDINILSDRKRMEDRLNRFKEGLFKLGHDHEENLHVLTGLCGDLLDADCALYNRLDKDLLCVKGQWNAPPGLKTEDSPQGHICFDVIRGPADGAIVICNLQQTSYAKTDPNVSAYGLQTYVGHPVRFGGVNRGSLCVVYARKYEPIDEDLRMLGILAASIAQEEERARAEEALRQSEERLRLALTAANQGLYDLNIQSGEAVVSLEYSAMLGYDPASFQETNAKWIARLHPDDREKVSAVYRAYVNGEIPEYVVEFRQKTKRGDWKWILSRGKIVERDVFGRPLRMLGTHTDITGRKLAEEERLELERRLLHAQKLESLGVLAGGIAHDFNNLLMGILGNLDLALVQLSPHSTARSNIELASHAAHSAADLTRQMLAYSGKGHFVVAGINLNKVVEENVHLLKASIIKSATLNLNLQENLPFIKADAGQIQQVIMNLITNASEAIGGKSGIISLSTGVKECDAVCLSRSRVAETPPPGQFVYLEIKDTGCGMDDNTKQRLFDPFFTTKFTGRGLGMPVILGIVRGHHGALFVDSVAGQGSIIRVLFPALDPNEVLDDQGENAEDVTPAGLGRALSPRGTILVVDDEELVRRVSKDMLEYQGWKVLAASDGQEALEVFRRHQVEISCILLDLSMPRMDGMTAFGELVKIKNDVKVILSSGYSEQDATRYLPARGLAGFIQKPYTIEKLRLALENALRNFK